jgi:IS1 family transposase
MNRTATEKRAMIIKCLTEGNSIRATVRMTGASKNTIIKLVVEFGEFAAWFQDKMLRNLPCTDLQLDEIWAFCGCKEKNKGTSCNPQGGDIWTWTAICRDTKLVPSWLVADRGASSAHEMVGDLASRLANRAQISTDGLVAYVHAVKGAFGEDVDFGRLIKAYGKDDQGREVVLRADKVPTIGKPNVGKICTSHVERQNLTMRMNMRRFTRLTNAFSKKAENHAAMVSIHFLNYNFVRRHQTIKTAPAVAAGVIDEPMTIFELLALFDEFRSDMYPTDRPLRYRPRKNRETYEPQTPLTPWYLDHESGGPNPPAGERKPGIRYRDEENSN